MKTVVYCFLFTGLIACSSLSTPKPMATEDPSIQLSRFIEDVLSEVSILPGISVAVVDLKGRSFAQGFGYSDANLQLPASAQTPYYIASTTKGYNGILSNLLAEEGLFSLQDPILKFAPFKDFKNPQVFENISIQDLLSHQSGIDNPYLSTLLAYTGDYSDAHILHLIETETIPNEEGKAFEYTNFGYYLLDVLLQEEFQLDWRNLLKEKMFDPLGMKNTSAYIESFSAEALAQPHLTISPDQIRKSYLMKTNKTMHAAGGLVTSAEDTKSFLEFLLRKGKMNDKQIVPTKVIESSFKNQVNAEHGFPSIFDPYGCSSGWRRATFQGEEAIYHFGGYPGFHSHVSFLPDAGIGVSVFINHSMGGRVANLIAEYAYDLYSGRTKNLAKHEKALRNEFPKQVKRMQNSEKNHQEKMAKRNWQLLHPKEAYTGAYFNEKVGRVEVKLKEGSFEFFMGNLWAKATAYPEDNMMRLEMIPNSGRVAWFTVKDGQAQSFRLDGETFNRVE